MANNDPAKLKRVIEMLRSGNAKMQAIANNCGKR
jgi:hypothetical protein